MSGDVSAARDPLLDAILRVQTGLRRRGVIAEVTLDEQVPLIAVTCEVVLPFPIAAARRGHRWSVRYRISPDGADLALDSILDRIVEQVDRDTTRHMLGVLYAHAAEQGWADWVLPDVRAQVADRIADRLERVAFGGSGVGDYVRQIGREWPAEQG